MKSIPIPFTKVAQIGLNLLSHLRKQHSCDAEICQESSLKSFITLNEFCMAPYQESRCPSMRRVSYFLHKMIVVALTGVHVHRIHLQMSKNEPRFEPNSFYFSALIPRQVGKRNEKHPETERRGMKHKEIA